MRNLEDAGIAELEKSWSTPRRVSASVKEKKQGNWLYSGLFKKILELDEELALIETQINQKCLEIPHTDKVLEICGIGENTLSGMVAEMGDISRFDDVKEIQKLSGLGLVASSSGKHKGETKISHRGVTGNLSVITHFFQSIPDKRIEPIYYSGKVH